MAKETQNGWVLAQLQDGARLSSRDAVRNYGIQDLPKRISELRRQGYRIESERVEGESRFGGKTHWCRYFMGAE